MMRAEMPHMPILPTVDIIAISSNFPMLTARSPINQQNYRFGISFSYKSRASESSVTCAYFVMNQ